MTIEKIAELGRGPYRWGELSAMGQTYAYVAYVEDKDMAIFGSGREVFDKPDDWDDWDDAMDHHDPW